MFRPLRNKERSKNGSACSYFKGGTFFVIVKFTFGPWSQQKEEYSLKIYERCQNISETAVTKVLLKMPKPCAIVAAAPAKIYQYDQ